MDLRVSPEDRVGGGPKSRKSARGKDSAKPQKAKAQPRKTKSTPRKSRAKQPLTVGRFFFKLFYWGFVLAIWGGIAVAGIVAYYALQLPSSNTWAVPKRPPNIEIVAADGRLISNRGKMGGQAVALRDLPAYVPEAVISIEDRRFYEHFGLDPIGIARAAVNLVTHGRIVGGGSTITQQLAKNLFLTPDQTLGRKVQEALLALWLEHNYTKDQILELYLNRMYFGSGAYGIEAAAQKYFGKSARNLSLSEAAILAGLLQAPSRLDPNRNPQAAAARARIVLGAMAEEGYISEKEAQAATIDPNEHIRTRVPGAEYYVADWVESLMQSYIGDVTQDVVVHTTINWDLQKEGEFLIREAVSQNGQAHNFSQGALVAMDTDGAVRALVGGVDYAKSQYNRAVTAHRQPGSAFKPIVYLTALEHGYTPSTIVEDKPLDYNGWQPENAEHKYFGKIKLKDALAYSLNTVAARLAIDVGPQNIVDTALRLGISTPIEAVPSIALGTSEVSLLELTGAYAPFANGGLGVIPHVITSIDTSDGKVLYQDIPSGPGRVVSPQNVAMMNEMLSNAVDIGTARNAHLDGWPVAGKTGTTQNYRDAMFVGYTAHMVTGVWVGNDDGSPMNRVGGGSYPAEIWSKFMAVAHKGLSPVALPGAYGAAPDQTPPPDNRPAADKPRTLVDLINQWFGGGG